MKYEIVGVQRKSGEYEGRPYDNTYLHVLNVNPNVTGRQAGTVKLKTPAFGNILQEHGISANDLLGRTVIATGGSVVYRASTMEHLASLGPVIYLEAPMNVVLERIARNPDRGLAIAPGQTVEELFLEREALYRRYASLVVSTAGVSPAESARRALEEIARWYA